MMGDPSDDDDEHGAPEENEDGPSDEDKQQAKMDAMDAFLKAVHASKGDEALEAFETLSALVDKDEDEPKEEPEPEDEEGEPEEDRP